MQERAVIRLSPARGEQLRLLARHRGKSITSVIEDVITAAIEDGELPDHTPGFPIFAVVGGVLFRSPDFELPLMPPQHARQIAHSLERAADCSEPGGARFRIGDADFGIASNGRGVVLVRGSVETGTKSAITRGVARDLARQLRTAADQASAH